jgi:hypothetical protein
MKKRSAITQSTAHLVSNISEQIKGISLTVPDQSLSVKELLQRSVRGGELRALKAEYLPEGDEGLGVDLDKMDKMERLEMSREVNETINTLRNKKWKTKEPKAPDTPQEPS